MSGFATLHGAVLECPDPRALAGFYAQMTGWKVVDDDGGPEIEWITLAGDDGGTLAFQRAPGYRAPAWPDPASSMQFHLDFDVADLDAAEREALALGATKFEHQPSPGNFRVYADPAGHVFCLCR